MSVEEQRAIFCVLDRVVREKQGPRPVQVESAISGPMGNGGALHRYRFTTHGA